MDFHTFAIVTAALFALAVIWPGPFLISCKLYARRLVKREIISLLAHAERHRLTHVEIRDAVEELYTNYRFIGRAFYAVRPKLENVLESLRARALIRVHFNCVELIGT